MKLLELDPQFLRVDSPTQFRHVESISEAQGVMFLCPRCFQKNGGEVGTHSIQVWFANRRVPEELTPKPRWVVWGTGLHDLSLSPSIQIDCWHGFVSNGLIR